jgi:hypothetical protein
MNVIRTLSSILVIASAAWGASALAANDMGALKGLAGGGDSKLSSLTSGSASNAAGVVEFCIRNKYLGGDAATSMKDKLMGKVSGGGDAAGKDDPGYADGLKGVVKTGDGGSVDLSKNTGIKAKFTEKACESVLEHSKSFL